MKFTKFKTKVIFTLGIYFLVWRHALVKALRDDFGVPLEPGKELLLAFVPIVNIIRWWAILNEIKAVGERTGGPVFLAADGRRLDRHGAGRIVRKAARRAGITKTVTPHTLRHAFITAALDAGVPLRDVQEAVSHADPRTTIRYDRARGSLDRHATYIVAAYIAGAAR